MHFHSHERGLSAAGPGQGHDEACVAIPACSALAHGLEQSHRMIIPNIHTAVSVWSVWIRIGRTITRMAV